QRRVQPQLQIPPADPAHLARIGADCGCGLALSSTLGPIAPGSVFAASAVHLTAARRRALRAAFGARPPSAAIPETSLASASSAPRLLFDQIHRPSASHLSIPMRGSEH